MDGWMSRTPETRCLGYCYLSEIRIDLQQMGKKAKTSD